MYIEKEILKELKCIHQDMTDIQKNIVQIQSDISTLKNQFALVTDHTIKFDRHIDFVETKFNWYKTTLDYLNYIVKFKFLKGTNQTAYPRITDDIYQ